MLLATEIDHTNSAISYDPKEPRIKIDQFSNYTYATRWHWELFKDYDIQLYGESLNLDEVDLKRYQDLFVFTFIKDYIPEGSKILDVGGGISRILEYFSSTYECWNIDKFEGIGNGPKHKALKKYKIVTDYMGNFNTELPNDYFDFVFSVSALEHVPQENSIFLQNIIDDINRVLKPGGYSLHLFDIVYQHEKLKRFNKFIYHVFTNANTINEFIHPNKVYADYDLYFLSEQTYKNIWQKITKINYHNFGQPTSINALWKKELI